MNELEVYIGTKIIKAEEMTQKTFLANYKKEDSVILNQMIDEDGYHVQYEDGYDSWSPKDVFERCYRKTTHSEKSMCNYSKRKLGYFQLNKIVILKMGDLSNLFEKLLFIPTKIKESFEGVKYEGYSEKFDELNGEERIPEYLIIMNHDGKRSTLDHVERKVKNTETKILPGYNMGGINAIKE